MSSVLYVPEVATGVTEVVLTEWLVAANVPFAAGDPIAVIETDKASVELPAESDATIVSFLVEAGATVAVGAPLAMIADGSNEPAAPADSAASPSKAGRVFASPLARRMLSDAGVSPLDVTGTGPNGRIGRADVQAHLAARPEESRPSVAVGAPPAAAAPGPSRTAAWIDVPHTRQRRAVANRLTLSKQTVPHFYLRATANVDRLLALRAEAQPVVKTSINDWVVKAVAHAHGRVPEMNAVWSNDVMRRFDSVDIAIAVAAESGLITPVLRSVEQMSIRSIADGVRDLVQRSAGGRLQQHEIEGGSITVTNLGMFGVEEFTAIINPPQSAILAVGAAAPEPVVIDGVVGVAHRMRFVLSVDHRAADGVLAARWMAEFIGALERPVQLLL